MSDVGFPEHLLLLHLPGRRTLGSLEAVLRKHGVQYVAGCEEPGVDEALAEHRAGLTLSLVGWVPASLTPARGRKRRQPAQITLPAEVRGVLDALPSLCPDGFVAAALHPTQGVSDAAERSFAPTDAPWAVGILCRVVV